MLELESSVWRAITLFQEMTLIVFVKKVSFFIKKIFVIRLEETEDDM